MYSGKARRILKLTTIIKKYSVLIIQLFSIKLYYALYIITQFVIFQLCSTKFGCGLFLQPIAFTLYQRLNTYCKLYSLIFYSHYTTLYYTILYEYTRNNSFELRLNVSSFNTDKFKSQTRYNVFLNSKRYSIKCK